MQDDRWDDAVLRGIEGGAKLKREDEKRKKEQDNGDKE